jgi:ribosomal protein S21
MTNIEIKIPRGKDNKTSVDKALQLLKSKLMVEGIIDTVRAKREFETPKRKRERKLRNRLKLLKKSFDKRKNS